MALSKEEKKAQKEAKRLAKLAAEAEARKRLKRSELQREIDAQALKRKALDKTWRQLMLKIQEPVFKQDIQILWHTFDRAMDKKDNTINYTMQLMDVADDQFQRTIASFCVTIDTMITKFLDDLNDLSNENDIRTKTLLKTGQTDADQIMTDHNNAETHLQLLIYHGHSTADTAAWTSRGEFLVREDEDRNKYADDRENLQSLLEDKYNALWDEYKAVVKAYVVETADNQKQVRKLRYKENLMADIIASQGKKIANSGDMLKKLRTELAAYESGTKQAVFRDRRNRHRAACFKLKKRLNYGCALDIKQLTVLVRSSDSTLEWLDAAAKKGEKILRMAALCRKLESRHEKIMPFGSVMPHSPISTKCNLKSRQDPLVMNAIASTCGLTRLWQRIAKAELTKRALYREKIYLQEENLFIISKLEECSQNKMEPETKKCSCSGLKKKKTIDHPVAIEGVLELSKYR